MFYTTDTLDDPSIDNHSNTVVYKAAFQTDISWNLSFIFVNCNYLLGDCQLSSCLIQVAIKLNDKVKLITLKNIRNIQQPVCFCYLPYDLIVEFNQSKKIILIKV